jgi:hypothetical protein
MSNIHWMVLIGITAALLLTAGKWSQAIYALEQWLTDKIRSSWS